MWWYIGNVQSLKYIISHWCNIQILEMYWQSASMQIYTNVSHAWVSQASQPQVQGSYMHFASSYYSTGQRLIGTFYYRWHYLKVAWMVHYVQWLGRAIKLQSWFQLVWGKQQPAIWTGVKWIDVSLQQVCQRKNFNFWPPCTIHMHRCVMKVTVNADLSDMFTK